MPSRSANASTQDGRSINIFYHPKAASMLSNNIYAEYLLNIRQVTVYATLPTPTTKDTSVSVTSEGRTLELRHDGEFVMIQLPAKVHDDAHSKDLKIGSKDLSFRFKVALGDQSQSLIKEDNSKRLAADLEEGTQVACLKCAATLVDAITQWKDLPSWGWADMMDFWHCHKPSMPHSQDVLAADNKGYAAGNTIGPAAGVGLLDVSHFLLHPSNCTGITVRSFF